MNAVARIWNRMTGNAPKRPPRVRLGPDETGRYPRVTVWLGGEAVASGDLPVLYLRPSSMARIMYRPFRRDGKYTATFYWADGAWSSVGFESAAEMNDVILGTAARLLRWPEPEAI